MKFGKEIEAFIKDYLKDLEERNAAIFAGAGMSKSVGYVDWPGLLREIADELGLNVDRENLLSVAQFHVNENKNRTKLNRKILEEFAEQAESSETHKIISRLPITTIWTTNYDTLIEDALEDNSKVVDIKHQVTQLTITKPKRDVVVYKMHGDVGHPANAIITKEQYEQYYKTHEHFITALNGDLISKTFLFIGFSFTDPNLDYVLSRLTGSLGENSRQHYAFIKKHNRQKDEDEELYNYNIRKQTLMTNDLKRYGIKALLIEDYPVITDVLREIENRYKKRTVFISGSAEEYGSWSRDSALSFIHMLSKRIIQYNCTIINGFGWGIGSAVINGSLEAIYEQPNKYSEDQLVLRPFPQFKSGKKDLPELWEEYRHRMISLAGVSIIVFGNKKDKDGKIINASGVMTEFKIAVEHGLIPVPISVTGYMASDILNEIRANSYKVYSEVQWIIPIVEDIASGKLDPEKIIGKVIEIIQTLNK